ncbi:DNA adenine methylase [Methanobacterium oryzae]|uniref:DNA adenine methylase n=1 Tax=Methanobacterium oryzae TaxID=69540 RepID=UPI003D24E0FA
MQINPKKKLLNARPFLKWVGGKTQLLNELEKRIPDQIREKKTIKKYIEPYVGGGALFFYLKTKYDIKDSYLFDINKELIVAYKTIQMESKALIDKLEEIENKHLEKSEENRKEHYYEVRNKFNRQISNFDYDNYNENWVERTSFLIFLNKTGFNGLFRQNQKCEFNVPFGRYNNPKIYDEKNIIAVSEALRNTEIICGDFTESEKYVEKESFIYFDPPYRPISKTSNFTTYAKNGFQEEDQIRLSELFKKMDKKGAYLMLSNSDPKNEDIDDDFFDELYRGHNIERVPAKRHINCDASKRGEINELIITNYPI